MFQNNFSPGKKYSRIISLVPSQTELLFYLGLEQEVVGITKFCVHPKAWFRNKQRVGGTKNVNFKTICALDPDLIIGNKEENVKEQIEELAKMYDVFITDVNNLADAEMMIKEIGELMARSASAQTLVSEINSEFKELKKMSLSERKIRAAYFIWKDPFMVAGGHTFIDNMMAFCGFENVFADRLRYPEISLDEIKDYGCELIILSSEPYPFKLKHKQEIEQKIPGVEILFLDGEMFSWYGSRLLKSARYFKNLFNNR